MCVSGEGAPNRLGPPLGTAISKAVLRGRNRNHRSSAQREKQLLAGTGPAEQGKSDKGIVGLQGQASFGEAFCGRIQKGAVQREEWFPELPRESGLEGGQSGEATG